MAVRDHSVWQTKDGKRALVLLQLLKWPAIGALVVGGGVIAARIFGPGVARDLGHAGGDAFAEGMVRTQNRLASAFTHDARWG